MQRRLAAILAADIVGYSAMMGADEAAALEALRLLREELFEPEVARRGGEVVKRLGDGWLVEFASVVDAVGCAIAAQEALAGRDFALRIGAHLGDIVHEGGDIYGDGVNIAARLEAVAAPGHVAISDDARRQVAGRVAAAFHDNGPMELKNIAEPVRVWSWPAPLPNLARPGGAKPRVHVAAFEARGAEAEDVAEGLREDLATIFSRQTAVTLVEDAGAADALVGGSVRAAGGRWRIGAHLTERASGRRIWSERMDETGDDVFAIQDRAAHRFAAGVRYNLVIDAARREQGRRMEELTVEELLNLSSGGFQSSSRARWEAGIAPLQLALERDPENWMAMAMMAAAKYATEMVHGWRPVPAEAADEAEALLRAAVDINGRSDFLRVMRCNFMLYARGDRRGARLEAEHALQINPVYEQALSALAVISALEGDFEAAKALALRSVDAGPDLPMYFFLAGTVGTVFALTGDHAGAVDWFRRADAAAPEKPRNLIGLAAGRQLSGDAEGAKAAMAALLAIAPEFNLAEMWPGPHPDAAAEARFRDALAAAGAPEAPCARLRVVR